MSENQTYFGPKYSIIAETLSRDVRPLFGYSRPIDDLTLFYVSKDKIFDSVHYQILNPREILCFILFFFTIKTIHELRSSIMKQKALVEIFLSRKMRKNGLSTVEGFDKIKICQRFGACQLNCRPHHTLTTGKQKQ